MQVFLEPEGRHSPEVYVQGFSTGLPERLQLALLHTLPGAPHPAYTTKRTILSAANPCTAPLCAAQSCACTAGAIARSFGCELHS